MSRSVGLAVLLAIQLPAGVVAQSGAERELALSHPRPHFVAALAPTRLVETARSAALNRRVALDLVAVPLDVALAVLGEKAALEISYSATLLPTHRTVTLRAADLTVAAALTEFLLGSAVDVAVDQSGRIALIACQHSPIESAQDSGSVSGRVTARASGTPIAGATVVVEGTARSASTNDAGAYRVGGLRPGTYVLRVRYIGYVPTEASVTVGAGLEATADFALEKSAQQLNEVVTTGTVVPTEVKALPTPVTVISDHDVARQRPTDVQQLFRQAVPTAVSWDLAPFPFNVSFAVRGATSLGGNSGQMKVFVDGIEIALPGAAAVDPSSIGRIEVIRGPQAAAIYGSDAIGGVIQVFTKRGDSLLGRPQLELEAAAGLLQTPYSGSTDVVRQSYRASVRGGGTTASYNVGAGYSHTGDYLPAGELSAQSNPSVYGGTRIARGPVSVDLSGRYYLQDNPGVFNPALLQSGFFYYSKPLFLPTRNTNQTVGVRINIAAAGWWTHTLSAGIDRFSESIVQARRRLTTPADTLLELFDFSRVKTSVSYTTAIQGSLSPQVSGSLTAGVDHYSLPVEQWFTVGATDTAGTVPTVPGLPFSVSRTVTTNTGYFAQAQLGYRDAVFLTGGVRAERNSDFGDSLGTPVSPRLGLAFVQSVGNATVKVRGSWGRAIRPPSPTQKLPLVSGTGVILGNPRLGPERQKGWDAGVDVGLGSRASLSATYYDETAEHLIQEVLVQATPPLTFQYQNVGGVKNTGVELEGRATVGPLELRAQYGYARARIAQLAPNYVGDLRVGDQALVTPKHTGGASVTIRPTRATTVVAGLSYIGSWTNYDFLAYYGCIGGTSPCRNATFALNRDYFVEYPHLVKVNASVTQQITPLLSAFVTVNNLTNNEGYEAINFNPVFGRLTTIGVHLLY